ncbi:arylesterase [Leptospira ryugenii]|uniref:Arylesterase n=1 Tax=Leptospira ryugenii TaxID=1917863 RepID=A0A2P2E1V3_9LEPT|nr:arylesterase [Leptospira ryugenii]
MDANNLRSLYEGKFESFSWGMDDEVILEYLQDNSYQFTPPFFIFIGLSQTHHPYFSKNETIHDPKMRYKAAIRESIETIDRIAQWLLKEKGEDILFILTSDHGESFGEQGDWGHNYSVYNHQTDVPFQVYFPWTDQTWTPKLGTSLEFSNWIQAYLSGDNLQSFASQEFELTLQQSTWNSNRQRALVLGKIKYIYHADRDLLLRMNLDETNQKQITNQIEKRQILQRIFETNKHKNQEKVQNVR